MKSSDYPKQAAWAETLPDYAEAVGGGYFKVGEKYLYTKDKIYTVTKIELRLDVPAQHCNTPRVCVLAGDELLAEFPYTALACIGYK